VQSPRRAMSDTCRECPSAEGLGSDNSCENAGNYSPVSLQMFTPLPSALPLGRYGTP
jgi:hypothetical protein